MLLDLHIGKHIPPSHVLNSATQKQLCQTIYLNSATHDLKRQRLMENNEFLYALDGSHIQAHFSIVSQRHHWKPPEEGYVKYSYDCSFNHQTCSSKTTWILSLSKAEHWRHVYESFKSRTLNP
uniref:Uncharacterized protein n=1 Tax=Noccaea caerulescens TaxID=107243 RepID=A0A1J3F249_NOCCA